MTNQFRAAVLSGLVPGKLEKLLGDKDGTGASADDLSSVEVARDASRTQDHRWTDRHRLSDERAKVRYKGKEIDVELVNLSGGGAMVRGKFEPRLWDRVDLILGESSNMECAVRWIRGDRIGLEFAHETQIQCEGSERDALLLEVIRRSFPDAELSRRREPDPDELPAYELTGTDEDEGSRRSSRRHPLIWMGEILYNHATDRVRLRNVSESGAMVEGDYNYPEKTEVMLDLGEAGQLFATVAWSCLGQTGLIFKEPFDLKKLAHATPKVAPHRWARPDFLRNTGDNEGPWAAEWDRASIAELREELDGFLGR